MTATRISFAAILAILISTFVAPLPVYAQETTKADASVTLPGQSPSGRPDPGAVTTSTATPTPSPSPTKTKVPRLTSRQKLQYGAVEAFLTPGAYVGPALNAFVVERQDVKAPGKTGEDKFADGLSRFGRAFATQSSAEFLGAGVYPALFKQNPIYQPSGRHGFLARAGYAASRSLLTSGDNGKTQPNFSRLLGNLTSASMANLYERDTVKRRDAFGRVQEYNRRVGARPTLESFAITTAFDALSHVLFDEFDILGKLRKKSSKTP